MANYYANSGEFQVNTHTTDDQDSASVAALSNGGFVVTWTSFGQDGNYKGVYGQRYNANGYRVGGEFQVNTYTTYSQCESSVIGLSGGGFAVAWMSIVQDGDSYGIYGQRYNATGSQVGSEFQVNTYTTSYQDYPSMTTLSDGGFVVTWTSYGQDGDGLGIYGQRYNATGIQVGSEFQVNTYTTNSPYNPSMTALSNGGFVVTWTIWGQDGDSYDVYGQRYNASGSRIGIEFKVNTTTANDQYEPSVTALSNGGFVVTWNSNGQDGDYQGVYGQRYNTSGSRIGSEFQVNTTTNRNQYGPSVAALNDGGFVVTWTSSSQHGVYGQRYNANGYRVGSEFQVNTYTTNDQLNPSVTALSDGGFVVSWSSTQNGDEYGEYGQDGSGNGVYGQRFRADGTPWRDFAGTSANDTWRGGAGNDRIKGLAGNDALFGEAGNDIIDGGAGNDTLDGQDGNDILLGKAGKDILVGRFGNDTLSGGRNNDFLFGRDGNDILTGGGGSDIFVFDCTLNAATNNDTITDFSHVSDTVRLDRTIFTKFTVGTLLSTQFRASATGAAADRNDFFLYNTSTGALLYDNDGSRAGVATQFATLTNIPQNVTYNDFVVVA